MLLITLNSDNKSSGYSYDFNTNFNPNVNIGQNKEIALHSLQMWNSLPNISPTNPQNNIFRYYNGVLWSNNLIIPTGSYSVEDLNEKIKELILNDGGDPNSISLIPNYNTLKCAVVLKNSYQLDLSPDNTFLKNLLGFSNGLINVTSEGDLNVDISNGITSYNIHCSLIDSSASISNGSQSSVIFSFTPNVPAGNLINQEPINLIYLKCNTNNLSLVNIRITDQNNNTLYDLSNENISITLIVR